VLDIFNPSDNATLIARVEKLRPDSTAKWGKMNVAQMCAHTHAALAVALGELKLPRTWIGRLLGGLAKRMLVGEKPFSENSPTHPLFVFPASVDFVVEREKLKQAIRRLGSGGHAALTKDPHPFFGPLTPAEWSNLQSKHVDHHLRQFGV
jgi:Protein of unknown function (DUF1569)